MQAFVHTCDRATPSGLTVALELISSGSASSWYRANPPKYEVHISFTCVVSQVPLKIVL